MTIHLEPPAGTTLYIPFTTYGANGESLTMTGLAVGDIKIYKDGSTTERASTAGFTLLDTDGIDFDGVTGLHGFSIDLSDNTTANFYAAGSFYWVVVSTITVNGQTVTLIPATFRICVAENTTGTPVVDAGRINNVATTSVTTVGANVGTTQPVNFTGTGASAYVKSDLTAISTDTTAADNAESFFDGTGYAGTNNVIPLVTLVTTTTNLTNAPGVIFTGTASDAATDSVTFTFDGDPTGMSIVVDSDEGIENRVIDEWDPLNSIATVVPAFAVTPSGTITVTLYPLGARVATQLEEDIADIKAVTDQVEFDAPGALSTNVKYVNDGQVDGSGSDSDPWGPVA